MSDFDPLGKRRLPMSLQLCCWPTQLPSLQWSWYSKPDALHVTVSTSGRLRVNTVPACLSGSTHPNAAASDSTKLILKIDINMLFIFYREIMGWWWWWCPIVFLHHLEDRYWHIILITLYYTSLYYILFHFITLHSDMGQLQCTYNSIVINHSLSIIVIVMSFWIPIITCTCNWRAPWKNRTSRYISFFRPSLNSVLFPIYSVYRWKGSVRF